MLSEFFQLGPIPSNQILGNYNLRLVLLSYLVATFASYIALDMTSRLRDVDNTKLSTALWLIGGAFAMGAGIWSMHFIGMLAFQMPMQMSYNLNWTLLSMAVAVIASAFALFLLKERIIYVTRLIFGGIILGLAIASMHYIGMHAMNMTIHYIPEIFFLSIVIAILASEAAIWLALKSNQGNLRIRIRLKLLSAFIMGAAISGMHYTGMAAAIFTPATGNNHNMIMLNPEFLSFAVTLTTFLILGIAFAVSTYKEILIQKTIKIAHQEGREEVTSNILHNVGNVLNSINMSATVLEKCVMNTELSGLVELNELIKKYKDNLSEFFSSSQGSNLVDYVNILSEYWQKENGLIKIELKKLIKNIGHIKEIISMQQSISRLIPHQEQVIVIDEILDEALLVANIETDKKLITIEKQYEKIDPVLVCKVKLLQILINLVQNAKHALIELNHAEKLLILKIFTKNKAYLNIQVIDNGIGIQKENFTNIFKHGFTTKKTGHGFGLHASAIAAKEMGGTLSVYSEGVGKGAAFTLELPYKIAMAIKLKKDLPQMRSKKETEYVK